MNNEWSFQDVFRELRSIGSKFIVEYKHMGFTKCGKGGGTRKALSMNLCSGGWEVSVEQSCMRSLYKARTSADNMKLL